MEEHVLQEILKIVVKNKTSLIIAPTGSGKTIRLPPVIGAAGKKIFISGPTVTGTLAVSKKVTELNPDVKVGYAAESRKMYDNNTMVVYVTSGHLRRKMLSYFRDGEPRDIDFCDVLMIDEMHSGSLDNTINVALWQKAHDLGIRVPNLLLVSATPMKMEIFPDPVEYEVFTKPKKLDILYHDEDILWSTERGDKLFKATCDVVTKIHKDIPIDDGDFLIFVSGKKEVDTVTSMLSGLENAVIYQGHGAMNSEEISLAVYPLPDNMKGRIRKIVVATNIMETTITIDGLLYVFDTLLEKRSETSSNGGERLSTTYISQDSAKQRAGRAGRTRDGFCYRMCTEEFFGTLEKHRPPEISRIPIYEPVMEILEIGQDPKEILKEATVPKIEKAMDLLEKLEMIVRNEDGGTTVTEIGKFSPSFPLGVRNTAFYYHWLQAGYHPFVGIIVSAMIDCYGPSYFFLPRKDKDESMGSYSKRLNKVKNDIINNFRGKTDLHTALNVWLDLFNIEKVVKPTASTVYEWCKVNNMNAKKINEILTIVKECVKVSERKGYQVKLGSFNPENVVKAARPILQKVYEDRIVKLEKGNLIDKNGIIFRFDNRESFNEIDKSKVYFAALCTQEIKSFTTMNIVSFSIDLPDYKPPVSKVTKAKSLTALKLLEALEADEGTCILDELGLHQEDKFVNCEEIASYSRRALMNFNRKEELKEFYSNPFIVDKPISSTIIDNFETKIKFNKDSLSQECKRYKYIQKIKNIVDKSSPDYDKWIETVDEILFYLLDKSPDFISFEEDRNVLETILIDREIVPDLLVSIRNIICKYLQDTDIFETKCYMQQKKVFIEFGDFKCVSTPEMEKHTISLLGKLSVFELGTLVMRYLCFSKKFTTYNKAYSEFFKDTNSVTVPFDLQAYGSPFSKMILSSDSYYCGPNYNLEKNLNNISKFAFSYFEGTTVYVNIPSKYLENRYIEHINSNVVDSNINGYLVRFVVECHSDNEILNKNPNTKGKEIFHPKDVSGEVICEKVIYLVESSKIKSSKNNILKKIVKI